MVAARCTLPTRTATSSRLSMNLPSAPNALVEAEKEAARQFSLLRRVAAWAVHAYTASGVVAGLFSPRAPLLCGGRAAPPWVLVAGLIEPTHRPPRPAGKVQTGIA